MTETPVRLQMQKAQFDLNFYIKFLYLFILNSAPNVLGTGWKSWACWRLIGIGGAMQARYKSGG